MNFHKFKHIHLTGIKGVGMTALALYLSDMGAVVTGSDVSEVFVTDEVLKKRQIEWKTGIKGKNISKKIDLLITTAAHGGLDNEEVKKAKKLGILVLTYAQALAELSYEKETICVCGVGGKTTVSSILSVVFDSAKLLPSFIVGVGNIYPINTPGRSIEEGRNFICEADDYVISPGINDQPKFSLLKPKIIIATNIEYDHPDVYENFDKTKEAFLNFFNKLPKYGYLVANADNPNTMEVSKSSIANVITYGFSSSADYCIRRLRYDKQKAFFDVYVKKGKKTVKNLTTNIPGKFNVQNAVAAYVAGSLAGISEDDLKFGLDRYLGCRRRFEDMGNYFRAQFIDDYAHHPKEISATIKAARDWFGERRIVVVFQPHTYSRTRSLFNEFIESLKSADTVALMDIYSSAREKPDTSVSSENLVNEIKKANKNAFYVGGQDKTFEWMAKNVKVGDVVITMGAGDIFHLYEKLKKIGV